MLFLVGLVAGVLTGFGLTVLLSGKAEGKVPA